MIENVPYVELFTKYLEDVTYPGYTFKIHQSRFGAIFMQAEYMEKDATETEDEERIMQVTRRWLLNPYMQKGEIVSTAFLLIMTSMEHRTREWFKYKGRAIYHPHYNVDELWDVANERETRPEDSK